MVNFITSILESEPSVPGLLRAEPSMRRFLSSTNQFREIIHTLSPDEQREARFCRLNKRDRVKNNKQRRLRLVMRKYLIMKWI